MNPSGWLNVIPLGVSGLALLLSFTRGSKIDAAAHARTDERVSALARRLDGVETELKDVTEKLSMLPQINEKLDGVKELVTLRVDTLDKTISAVSVKLDRVLDDRLHSAAERRARG